MITPTLIRRSPLPIHKVVGAIGDPERLLAEILGSGGGEGGAPVMSGPDEVLCVIVVGSLEPGFLSALLEPPYPLEVVAVSMDQLPRALQDERCRAVVLSVEGDDPLDLERIRELHRAEPQLAIVAWAQRDEPSWALAALRAGLRAIVPREAPPVELRRRLWHALAQGWVHSDLQVVIEGSADAMLVVDPEGTILSANTAACRAFCCSREQLLGSTLGLPRSSDRAQEVQLVGDPRPHSAEMRVTPIVWEEQRARLVSLQDTTERQRNIELERRLLHADRLAAIGQMAAGIAHEINNPATCLVTNLSLLQDSLQQRGALLHTDARSLQEHTEMLDDCQEGIQRIVRIARGLRSFSRIEEDTTERLDLNELLEDAVAMTANELRHRARLSVDLGELPTIVGDRAKLIQVFINLLLNAAHAIEPGAAMHNEIRVSTRYEGGQLVARVSDTGHGIALEDQEQIFEPFFTTKGRDVGTGLGLSLSLDTVQRHNGVLEFESTPGLGTEFAVRLPLDTTLSLSLPPRIEGGPALDRRIRILLIDDDRMVRHAVRRLLDPPHEVIEASGGHQALQHLSHDDQFQVVLCDLMMPELDGGSVYQEILRRHPAVAARTAFMSGGVFSERLRRFLAGPTQPVLDKPIPPHELRRVVQELASL